MWSLSPAAANLIGFAGAAGCLAGYGYTAAVARPDPLLQHGLNLAGALLLLVSLLVVTNLASLVLESLWALIAAFGLARALRR